MQQIEIENFIQGAFVQLICYPWKSLESQSPLLYKQLHYN